LRWGGAGRGFVQSCGEACHPRLWSTWSRIPVRRGVVPSEFSTLRSAHDSISPPCFDTPRFSSHLVAKDPLTNRMSPCAELGGEQGMYSPARLDAATGRLTLDSHRLSRWKDRYIALRSKGATWSDSGCCYGPSAALFIPGSRLHETARIAPLTLSALSLSVLHQLNAASANPNVATRSKRTLSRCRNGGKLDICSTLAG
jgi:hypothetical protein